MMMQPRPWGATASVCLVLLFAASSSAQQASAPSDPISDLPAPQNITLPPVSESADPAADPVTAQAVVPAAAVPADEEEPLEARIAIPRNPQVMKYVEQFSTTKKKFLENALARGSQYLPMIQAIFEAEGLPQDWGESG